MGVRRATLNNPGLRLRVDIVGTSAEGRVEPRSKEDLGTGRRPGRQRTRTPRILVRRAVA
ncbi:hypothetical protein [Amycolatopsis carbonis]|uniref:hypothetical protein n=1 Tax=Amycolatopsis carbonis TaxID=715471 RepID=UPI00333E2361